MPKSTSKAVKPEESMLHRHLVIGTAPYGAKAPAAARPGPKPRRKIWKRLFVTALICLLGVGGYFGYTLYRNGALVFKGNIIGAVFDDAKPLETDANGRSNILVFGSSEDEPGHPGGDLTDSIIVVSVDQNKNDALMFSVPRDLWVKYPASCDSSAGKVNAVFHCGKLEGGDEIGQRMLRDTVGTVYGLDIQYSIQVNYEVVRQSVDALDGIEVVIESTDPRGILDRNFDWKCRYRCYMVKYPNGPAHLTGEQAMHLARARNAAGGYGLSRGNFDREVNQRKIMLAAREKAASIGFLSNPLAVTQLLNSLGDNVRSNFEATEIKTLLRLSRDVPTDKIASLALVDQKPALLTTGAGPDGTSIVRPVKGLTDYSAIRNFIEAERRALQMPPPSEPSAQEETAN